MILLLLLPVILLTSEVFSVGEEVILASNGLNVIEPPLAIGRKPNKGLWRPEVTLPWERSDKGHPERDDAVVSLRSWQPNFSDQDFVVTSDSISPNLAQSQTNDVYGRDLSGPFRKEQVPTGNQDGQDIQGFTSSFTDRVRNDVDFETISERRRRKKPISHFPAEKSKNDYYPTIGSLLRLLFFGRSSSSSTSAKAKRRRHDHLGASVGRGKLSPTAEKLLKRAETPAVNLLAVVTGQFLAPYGFRRVRR